jgi:glutathione S-transferase
MHIHCLGAKRRLYASSGERLAIARASFCIGHIAIGCALGYTVFRFPQQAWRNEPTRIAGWFETFMQRPSSQLTIPADA